MATPNNVDAILMASGFSKRFGNQNKLLFPFRGKPLALYTLELVCGMDAFDNVYFMWADEAVAHLAERLPVSSIHNLHPEYGSRESIRLGVSASSASYYMFFTCDQPLLDAGTIGLLLDARRPGCITVPSFEGKPGSPTIFSSAFRDALLTLGPGRHARDIKRACPDKIIDVPLPGPLPIFDLDTEQDIQRLEKTLM